VNQTRSPHVQSLNPQHQTNKTHPNIPQELLNRLSAGLRHLKSAITVLQVRLKARQNKTTDIKEVVMNLSPVYEEWRQKTLDEGRVEGRVEERRSLALKMLQGQFAMEVISQLTELSIEQLQSLQQHQS
jgi:predicted transposase YdaD